MSLIDFIKQFVDHKNEFTNVTLEWFWVEEGIDEEYCFEGKPDEFMKKYTKDYDCLDNMDIFDVKELEITNTGLQCEIYIKIVEV